MILFFGKDHRTTFECLWHMLFWCSVDSCAVDLI